MSKSERIDRLQERRRKQTEQRAEFRRQEQNFKEEFDSIADMFGVGLVASGKGRKKGKGKHRIRRALKKLVKQP